MPALLVPIALRPAARAARARSRRGDSPLFPELEGPLGQLAGVVAEIRQAVRITHPDEAANVRAAAGDVRAALGRLRRALQSIYQDGYVDALRD